jgi:hypothetical protein
MAYVQGAPAFLCAIAQIQLVRAPKGTHLLTCSLQIAVLHRDSEEWEGISRAPRSSPTPWAGLGGSSSLVPKHRQVGQEIDDVLVAKTAVPRCPSRMS